VPPSLLFGASVLLLGANVGTVEGEFVLPLFGFGACVLVTLGTLVGDIVDDETEGLFVPFVLLGTSVGTTVDTVEGKIVLPSFGFCAVSVLVTLGPLVGAIVDGEIDGLFVMQLITFGASVLLVLGKRVGCFDDTVEGEFVLPPSFGFCACVLFKRVGDMVNDEIDGLFVMRVLGAFVLLEFEERLGTFDDNNEGISVLLLFSVFAFGARVGTFDGDNKGIFVMRVLGAFELPVFGARVGCLDDEVEGFFVLPMFGAFELLCTRVGTFDDDNEGIFVLLLLGAFELPVFGARVGFFDDDV